MFDIDDMADKDLFEETSGNPSEEPQTDPVPPTEDPTKAYSERLKKEKRFVLKKETLLQRNLDMTLMRNSEMLT